MDSVGFLLADLVQIAETPLYSAYAWLGRELGRPVSMEMFFRLVDDLMAAEVLRLRMVDDEAKTQFLERVPEGLEREYAAIGHGDARFDPFGLSLLPGPKMDMPSVPTWEFDADFVAGAFVLHVPSGDENGALQQMKAYFPDVTFTIDEIQRVGRGVRVTGRALSS